MSLQRLFAKQRLSKANEVTTKEVAELEVKRLLRANDYKLITTDDKKKKKKTKVYFVPYQNQFTKHH